MTPGLAVSSHGPRVMFELVALTHGILRACLIPAADNAEDGVGYTLEARATEVLVGYEDPRDRLCALIGLAHVCTALEELLVQVPALAAWGTREDRQIHLCAGGIVHGSDASSPGARFRRGHSMIPLIRATS